MKLLQKILFVSVVIMLSVISIRTVYAANQIEAFNRFTKGSWKSERIPGLKISTAPYITIEQWLINEFNTLSWEAANSQKISNSIRSNIKDYYNRVHNPVGWQNDLDCNDSPRQWLKKLDLREICRFKEYIVSLRNHLSDPVNLIDNSNYNTDDLVKARALCGTFVAHDGANVCGHFSGMLVPGQAFGSATYSVHTCMHGFGKGNRFGGRGIITYYFVPYGVTVNDIPGHHDNAARKGFKVTSIKQGGQLNPTQFNVQVAATAPATLYNQNDYAIVTIEKTNAGGTSLYDILKSVNNANPIGAAIVHGEISHNQITNLPNINEVGDLQINTGLDFDPATEKLFIIGRAPNASCALDNWGLAICIMLKNEALTHNENRSSENNENVKDPPHKVNINTLNESFSSLPSYPGISGGVILRCKMSPDGRKKCAFIGTNWGSERIFNGSQLKGLGHFINKP